MLRTNWAYSASAAVNYLSVSDYFASSPGEILGKGTDHLNTKGMSDRDLFETLVHNLDPATGLPLRPHAREGDRVGIDFTFNAPKSVSIARELAGLDNEGDPRIESAHREAVAYAMKHVEADMQCRVRVSGLNENRTTGNMIAYRVTHRDTRINADDQMPDMSLHDHCFVLNATFDPVEKKWKAAELGQIKHDACYYESLFHNRLAHNLKELGYGIRREGKAFEISGIDRKLIDKFSRRRQYIKAVAEKLGITSPEGMSKLGATTRLGKTKELADDLNGYYVSRLTDAEKRQLSDLKGQPGYECTHDKAVRYAIGHEFYTKSVVEERKLYETAIRHGIGSVTPEGIQKEAMRQGVLLKDGEATTKAVLAEEGRIIAFAREGRGTCKPLGNDEGRTNGVMQPSGSALPRPDLVSTALELSQQQKGRPDESKRPLARASTDALGPISTDRPYLVTSKQDPATLSPEQQAICRHVWESPDRVILIRGAAGTGKTTTMKATLSGIDKPVAVLAPTVPAARGVLRQDFPSADTVAAFLGDKKWQERIKNGVIYVDEAGLLPIKDLSALVDVTKEQNARLILQADPKQHKSVLRNGNMFRALQEYAGLPVAELRDIKRQSGRYKEAVAAIESGDILKGFDIFNELKWVKQVSDDKSLVDEYLRAIETKKPNQSERDRAIILAPTHMEGDAITAELRNRFKESGRLGEESTVRQLVPLHWSEAERGDLHRYTGQETLVFHRNSGTFKAGDVVKVSDFKEGMRWKSPEHFAVYEEGKIALAKGEVIRTTSGINDTEGKRIDNGTYLTVSEVTKDGIEVKTSGGNKRTLPLNVGRIDYGYTSTSIGGQGRTVDKVFAAMGSESLPALKQEQFYTDLSRARFDATIYTDLSAARLREVIQRADTRKSATELMKPKLKKKRTMKDRTQEMVDRVKRTYEFLRDKAMDAIRDREQQRGISYGR